MNTKNAETNDSAAAVAAQSASVAPEAAAPKRRAERKKSAPQAPKSARGAKSGKRSKKGVRTARKAESPRAESKTWQILELIRRAKGATVAEIMAATGWQAHSVRGFLSTAGKKHNVKIESEKNEGGARLYRIQE